MIQGIGSRFFLFFLIWGVFYTSADIIRLSGGFSREPFFVIELVDDIKAYVDRKPKNFRLLFMIDEAGQYVGTDTDMLLNLQSLTEKNGSECGGKVWVVRAGHSRLPDAKCEELLEIVRFLASFERVRYDFFAAAPVWLFCFTQRSA